MSDSNNITVLNPGLYKNLLHRLKQFTTTATSLVLKQGRGTMKQQNGSVSS